MPRRGWPRRNFVKMFDAGKTRMIGLPIRWKSYDNIVKPFSSNTGTSRTDRRTDRIAISISRVSVVTRDKNEQKITLIRLEPACNLRPHHTCHGDRRTPCHFYPLTFSNQISNLTHFAFTWLIAPKISRTLLRIDICLWVCIPKNLLLDYQSHYSVPYKKLDSMTE